MAERIFIAIVISLFLIAFSSAVQAQKLYIWCPRDQKIHAKATALSGIKVNLVILDERQFGKRVRSKCTSDDLIADLTDVIQQTYPSASFNRSTGVTETQKGTVNIEIKILQYAARFYPGMWHANTEYAVKIVDDRTGTATEKSLDIPKERNFFNLNGYSTAKSNLSKTYAEATADLLNFIDETLTSK